MRGASETGVRGAMSGEAIPTSLVSGLRTFYFTAMEDASPDRDERIRDFLVRHGGPSNRPGREGKSQQGASGWSEIYAMDGYALRCEWSQVGTRHEMTYSEIAPVARA